MSEATAPAEQPTANQPSSAFDLGMPFFEIGFSVAWPGPEGKIDVVHRFRRPTPQEESEYKKQIVYQERIAGGGKITDERADVNEAVAWLWGQIIDTISGYPGLADGTPVTPEIAAKMRTAHKDLAIGALFECEAEVLPEESRATFDGGEWAVRLKLGSSEAPYAVLKLTLREWTEREKSQFEKSAGYSSSEQQGKTRLTRAGVNQSAFTKLFDDLLLNVEADKTGLYSSVTVGGQPFAQSGKDPFAAAFLGEWKVEVISALTRLWRKKLGK